MPSYSYKLRTAGGSMEKGVIQATGKTQALQKLHKLTGTLIDVRELKKSQSLAPLFSKSIPLKERLVLTEQLSVMIRAGIGLTRALRGLRDESTSPAMRSLLTALMADIEAGNPFSDALAKHPRVFPPVFVQMIKASEQTGTVAETLARLTIQQQKEYDLKGKIRGALMYPAVVSVIMVAVIILIVTFIIPSLTGMFTSSGVPLPASTQFLLNVSYFMVHDWYWLIIGIFALIFGVRTFINTSWGGLTWDRLMLKLPVMGMFMRKSHLARFCQTFAVLEESGVPILEIFTILQGVIINKVYAIEIANIAKDVENGISISTAIRKSREFPAIMGQLISVGEQSGDLSGIFTMLGDFFEKEVDGMSRNLSSLLEPIIMIVMGVVVGFILISVIQPIYGIVNTV